MPVVQLNNVATQDAYTDTLTVLFARPRPSFALQVMNKAVFYKLAVAGVGTNDVQWEMIEHQLVPSLNSFQSPVDEGFAPGAQFRGIQLRSAATGQPARVTVI